MATCYTETRRTYYLELTQEEAEWIKGWTQNGPAGEMPTERDLRCAIFHAIATAQKAPQ